MKRLFPADEKDPNTILIVLPTWVGDFVMATPALRAIRERFASTHITFLLEANLLDLAHGGPWMDECVAWPPKGKRSVFSREYREFVAGLRRRRFDCAILLSNSFRSALLARLIGAKRRVGYDRDGRSWLLTDRIPVTNRRTGPPPGRRPSLSTTVPVRMGTHIPGRLGQYHPMPLVDYYADLAEAIGCPRPGDKLELFSTPESERALADRLSKHSRTTPPNMSPMVVLSPGSKFGASKCWAPERFAEAADRLIEEHEATVLITCGPGEEGIATGISSAMKRPAKLLIDPLLTLDELKALIRRCDLLICNDAGPRHIAKAFDVPLVTVFGPTHPDWTATNYPDERIVRVDVDCGPCQQRICPLGHHRCMEAVSVDMVVAAARQLLETGRRLTQTNADKQQASESTR